MMICGYCGVEYDEGLPDCPLCHCNEGTEAPVSPADILDISKSENKRQLWELSIVLIISSIIITFTIDAVFGKGIRWSLYAGFSLLFIASVLTVTHFTRNLRVVTLSVFAATVMLLFALSCITPSHGWFLQLALPLTAAFFILGIAVVFLNSLSKYRGLNLIAVIFFALGAFTMVVEICTDLYIDHTIKLQWSVASSASLALLGIILIYVHYRLKRGRKLGGLFHV